MSILSYFFFSLSHTLLLLSVNFTICTHHHVEPSYATASNAVLFSPVRQLRTRKRSTQRRGVSTLYFSTLSGRSNYRHLLDSKHSLGTLIFLFYCERIEVTVNSTSRFNVYNFWST